LKINPNYPHAWYNRACGKIKEGEIESSLDDLEESFKKGPALIEWSKKDQDLDSIRTNERFLEIMRKYSTSTYRWLIKQIDNKAKVLFATACLSYDILRRYFPIKDGNIVIDEILGDSSGRFMRKPVHIDELVQRVKSELLS